MNAKSSKGHYNFHQYQHEYRNIPDFAKGDHEASSDVQLDKTEDSTEFDDSREKSKFIKHHQKLTGPADDDEHQYIDDSDDDILMWKVNTDEKNNIPNKPILSNHVHFKPCSNQSLADLRRESRTLLSVKQSNFSSSSSPKAKQPNEETNSTTIFDLCWDDRKRVGQLIAELASTHENNKLLEQQVLRVEKQEERYKMKSSNLMKKVDVLAEKCHKLDSEKEQLKEKHLQSLTTLRNKILSISEEFETSAQQIQILTTENKQLKGENKSLQMALSTQEVKLKSLEDINARTKSLLEISISREKTLQSDMRKISEELERKIRADELKKRIAKQMDNGINMKSTDKNLATHAVTSEVDPGSKLQVPKSNNVSPLSLSKETNRNFGDFTPISAPIAPKSDINKCKNVDKEEAILQDLFFKF